MKGIKEKLIMFFLSFFLIVTPSLAMVAWYDTPAAYAGVNSFVQQGLSGDISTHQAPGVYSSQGSNIYSLGYSNLRFNTVGQNLQLFTISPPTFSIGCSGISATFGAFTMLGKKLMKALQSIIQSGEVLVFAFNMVLGVLCKQCEHIMNQIEAIANKLNGLNFNSCQAAQSLGNLAGAEIDKITNVNQVTGATNGFADAISSDIGSLSNTIGNYVNTINNFMNCSSTPQGAQYLVTHNFSSCGEAEAANKFQWGSAMRYAFSQAHIGLIGGTTPGSGGVDDIMAFLRANVSGDIVGYTSSSDPNGKEVVKYIAPVQKTNTTASGSNAMINMFNLLTKGANNVSYMTIAYPPQGSGSTPPPETLNQIEQLTPNHCFPGFNFYFEFYLSQVEVNEFGSQQVSSFPATSPICPSVTITGFTQQQVGDFIKSSKLPVVLITKLAYTLNDPALISTAAQAMSYGYVYNLFNNMLQSLKQNLLSGKNIDNQIAMPVYKLYLKSLEEEKEQIAQEYELSLKNITAQMNTLKYFSHLNKQWVSSLAKYGLAGTYIDYK